MYEIVNEAIILPLFFFVGKVVDDKKEFTNRLKTGLLLSLGIYVIFSAIVMIFAEPLLSAMATVAAILKESATYIRIESVANIFGIQFSFVCVVLVSLGRDNLVYLLTGAKLALCLVCDTFLVSTLPISANLGVNGIGVSNIIVCVVLFVATLVILAKAGYNVLTKEKMSFVWAKDFAKIGGVSGLESLVRNVAYMLFESVVTNSVYYGTFFVLYLTGVWTPTLLGIALMFGIGNAFDSVVSWAAYHFWLKKNHIRITDAD